VVDLAACGGRDRAYPPVGRGPHAAATVEKNSLREVRVRVAPAPYFEKVIKREPDLRARSALAAAT